MTLTQNSTFQVAPAGIAGDPINLALTDPSGGQATGPITLTVTGVPSDWSLNQGTNNGNGSWTVETNDLSALTVTTASTYAGAMVLGVTETWTNADGSTGTAVLSDNVEAYAPGAPIFAISGNDTLTGAGGNDFFVFAQPIGMDAIHNFNTATDKIDLMGFAGIASFGELAIAAASNGDAVITLGAGETITLHGVDADSLTAANFVFDQTPVTNNSGSMVLSDGALLPLGGTINNVGAITLNSTGHETDLQIIGNGVTLQGGGNLILSDSHENVIVGTTAATTLTNIDNTISGAGQIGVGDNTLTLVNEATIIADGTNALIIDTGANAVVNSGTLEATGSGGLIVDSNISDTGLIWANDGNITINGAVTGTGSALINGATLEFAAASSINVTFAEDNFGTLVLDNPTAYTGQIFGFGGASPQSSDAIDLKGITFDAGTSWTYFDNAGSDTGGSLTIYEAINGATTALDTLTFANGDYTTANFILTSDGNGGTLIADPPPDSGTVTIAAHDSFIFIGSANADTLIGGPQNDTFIGGGGGDTMKGGGGSDTFVFKTITDSQPGTGHFDTITDFTAGTDRIDLSAIVGASNVQGLVGMANTVAANSISWFADNAHNETVLYVNTTAAANHVDMEIHLTGTNINLTGSDILHHA